MKLVSLRADGTVHREWSDVQKTVEPWAFLIRPNTEVKEGDGRIWSSPFPVIAVFFPRRFYQAFILLKPEGTSYYCNVITPPAYDFERQQVVFHDLALDVLLDEQGARIVDVEEFYQQEPNYSPSWLKPAEAAAEELLALATIRKGVFSYPTDHRWRTWTHAFLTL